MTGLRRLAAAGLAVASLAWPAAALAQSQEPTAIGVFGDWAAYSYKVAGGKVCYVVAQPNRSEPRNAKRDHIFLMVTHRTKERARNVVSTIIGYPFKKESTVELAVDGNAFKLFPVDDNAWADTAAKDKEIVTAMKKGKTVSIKGTSERGTDTTDSYSLVGLTDAMRKIDEACK